MFPFPLPGGSLPWAFGLLAAVAIGGYIKGCSDERERFDAFKAQVEAVGEAQRERTLARIAEAKLRKKEADDAHAKEMARLRARLRDTERRMRDALDTGGGPVPAVPGTPGSGDASGLICFDREALDRGLRGALERLLAGTAGVIARGDEARAALRACAEWAMKEYGQSR